MKHPECIGVQWGMELTNAPKVAAVSILLNRAEGPTAECGEVLLTATRSASAWDRASAMLRAWSHTAPKKGGGYDKCDFTVTFADGETYKGRYDLHHMEVEMPDLAKHLRGELEFYTGDHKPAHLSDADYARVRDYSGHSPEEFRAYLAAYDIL